MPGSDINSLPSAPNSNPHQLGLTAAQAGTVSTQRSGVNSHGFDTVVVNVSVHGSNAGFSCTMEVLYWDDNLGQYAAPTPAEESTLTGTSSFVCQPGGRFFMVRPKALTLGSATSVDIFVSGQPSDYNYLG